MTRKTTVTFTFSADAHGNVTLSTDLAKPSPGAPANAAQMVALELLTHCQHQGLTVNHGIQAVPALALAHDITLADGYAYAVPESLWRAATDVVNRSQHHTGTGPLTPADLRGVAA